VSVVIPSRGQCGALLIHLRHDQSLYTIYIRNLPVVDDDFVSSPFLIVSADTLSRFCASIIVNKQI
jgi:hypothetical protein